MKRTTSRIFLAILTATVLSGCVAGPGVKPVAHKTGAAMYLDDWLKNVAVEQLRRKLVHDPFVNQYYFIITKLGDNNEPDEKIDPLTLEVRKTLSDYLLKTKGVKLLAMDPVRPGKRSYSYEDLRCTDIEEYQMVVMIDIEPLDRHSGDRAMVRIRARNVDTGEWIQGFSIFNENTEIVLTQSQISKLRQPPEADATLQGTRYFPYRDAEFDIAGAYLASNLSCMFRTFLGASNRDVYVTRNKVSGSWGAISDFLRNELIFFNEIRIVDNRNDADWVIDVEPQRTGVREPLFKIFANVKERKAGGTFAKFNTFVFVTFEDQSSKWRISDVSGILVGFMTMSERRDGDILADIYGPDGEIVQRGIIVNRRGNYVEWAYYNGLKAITYDVGGVMFDGGNTMKLAVRPFPPVKTEKYWTAVRVY